MTFKIEIGPTYRLRDGRTAMLLDTQTYRWTSSNPEDYGAPREIWWFKGIILENGEPFSTGPSGRYSPVGIDHHLDIVAIDGPGN